MIHRRLEYGPFDYEWSPDLRGIELTYCGQKFGEICSECEIYADLREHALPMRVVEVASVVMGCMLLGVISGHNSWEKTEFLKRTLASRGYEQFCSQFEAS